MRLEPHIFSIFHLLLSYPMLTIIYKFTARIWEQEPQSDPVAMPADDDDPSTGGYYFQTDDGIVYISWLPSPREGGHSFLFFFFYCLLLSS